MKNTMLLCALLLTGCHTTMKSDVPLDNTTPAPAVLPAPAPTPSTAPAAPAVDPHGEQTKSAPAAPAPAVVKTEPEFKSGSAGFQAGPVTFKRRDNIPTATSVDLVRAYLQSEEGREAIRDLRVKLPAEAACDTALVLADQGRTEEKVAYWALLVCNDEEYTAVREHLMSVTSRPHWYSWGSVSLIEIESANTDDAPAKAEVSMAK